LWLGTLPALLKGFFEQVFWPGFAISRDPRHPWLRMLKGRSARIILTMGMPGLLYRWYFLAHSLKSPGAEYSRLLWDCSGPGDLDWQHRLYRQSKTRSVA
jgi:putative NADPH-quinone reductase